MKNLFKNPKIVIPAAIIIITVVISILSVLNSPRFRVIAALYDALDTEMIDNCLTAPVTVDAGFIISSLECEAVPDDSIFSGAGLKLSAMTDIDNRMSDVKLTPTFLIYAAPSICIRQRDDLLGISSPELYDKELVFDVQHPFDGYENSELCEMLGTDLPEDLNYVSADQLKYPAEIKKKYSKKELRKKILESDIKKNSGYAPLTAPDGHEYDCESYTLTLSSGEIITVCIDRAGKLRCLKYDCASLYFYGTKEVTDEFYLEIEQLPLKDDITITLTAYGTADNYKQNKYSMDKEFTVEADNIEFTLYSERNTLIHINGSANATLLPGDDTICDDLPDEDLYSMSRSDIQNALAMIYGNLHNNQLTELIMSYMGETGFDDPMSPETR